MATNKVNICGIPHTIVEKEEGFASSETHFGQIDYSKCEIILNRDLTPEMKKETLCHEIIHGILVHIGHEDISVNEQVVQALGNAISKTFDVKYISEDDDECQLMCPESESCNKELNPSDCTHPSWRPYYIPVKGSDLATGTNLEYCTKCNMLRVNTEG